MEPLELTISDEQALFANTDKASKWLQFLEGGTWNEPLPVPTPLAKPDTINPLSLHLQGLVKIPFDSAKPDGAGEWVTAEVARRWDRRLKRQCKNCSITFGEAERKNAHYCIECPFHSYGLSKYCNKKHVDDPICHHDYQLPRYNPPKVGKFKFAGGRARGGKHERAYAANLTSSTRTFLWKGPYITTKTYLLDLDHSTRSFPPFDDPLHRSYFSRKRTERYFHERSLHQHHQDPTHIPSMSYNSPGHITPNQNKPGDIMALYDHAHEHDQAMASDSPLSDSDDDNQQGYAMLSFADAHYIMVKPSVIIGRDMSAYRVAQAHNSALVHQFAGLNYSGFGHFEPLPLDTNPATIQVDAEEIPDEIPVHPSRSQSPHQSPRALPEADAPTLPQDEAATLPDADAPTSPKDEVLPLAEDEAPKSPKADAPTSPKADAPKSPLNDTPQSDLAISHHALTLKTQLELMEPKKTDAAATSNKVPFVSVHSHKDPGDPFLATTGVSRQHVKIEFNPSLGCFELHVLGRNGVLVNGHLEPQGGAVSLSNNDKLQIADIPFTFNLPNIEDDDDEESIEGTQPSRVNTMFEDRHGQNVEAEINSSSDDSSIDYDEERYHYHEFDEELSDSDDLQESVESEDAQEENEQADPVLAKVGRTSEKKPGKKNHGIPSQKSPPQKVKLKLTQKHKTKTQSNKEGKKPMARVSPDVDAPPAGAENSTKADKKGASDKDKQDAAPLISRDVALINGKHINIEGFPLGAVVPAKKKGPGRPPKDGVMSKRERQSLLKAYKDSDPDGKLKPEEILARIAESRKADKDRKNSKGELVVDGDATTKEGSKAKSSRPEHTPPPERKMEDYTPEELARPTENYIIVIYQILQAHPEQKMNLQQIYAAIEQKYPYFKFCAGTTGWQSSVRHNLGQGKTFQKVERDGKGWLWAVSPGITLESLKEKKRKTTPPQFHPPHHPPVAAGYSGYNASHPGSYPNMANGAPATGYPMQGQHPPRQSFQPPPFAHANASNASRPPNYQARTGVTNAPVGYPIASGPSTSYHPPPLSSNTQNRLPPSTAKTQQPPTMTPRPPQPRPSRDVIDTFITVFTNSFRDNQEISMNQANRIVKNAVARVLDPDQMIDKPIEDAEMSIIDQFRRCVEQSQPRSNTSRSFGSSALPDTFARSNAFGLHTPTAALPTAAIANASATAASVTTTVVGSSKPPNPSPVPQANATPNGFTGSSSATPQPFGFGARVSNTPTAPSDYGPPSFSANAPSLADQVRAAIDSPTHSAPRPDVEAITPPTTSRKRSIDETEDAESQDANKKQASVPPTNPQ
ncbi:hypothetical protein BT63DRAFT_450718 [Microthyrium microscopicum]|uniref:Fork-head domain-containing protein n=1 Tax=Microthyrium microscopicum TaxID=703497 RepID=A0A6A6UKF1_9PEZI|nr:hypothetical protein BT63DRAFT_450718 [Microthyrium microscopicum]